MLEEILVEFGKDFPKKPREILGQFGVILEDIIMNIPEETLEASKSNPGSSYETNRARNSELKARKILWKKFH